ncbi:MAG: putative DNA-binding domain-containing protein [Gammaproteobacteria bacterium]|nr:putative DNA-binding domain-containing protein [Gammaproteobacteria bacterium]
MSAAPDLFHNRSELPEFQQRQYAFAAHIRNPDEHPKPADVPDARMAVYSELFYNNIEGTLSSAFPVIRSISSDENWHALVRHFFSRHRALSPYLTELPQEFLNYLQNERINNYDPEFLFELAHYEWVELALGIATSDLDTKHFNATGDLMEGIPFISPLAWPLSYQYPVHQISPEFQPRDVPEQMTHIVVYRDLDDEVNFLELNPVTARLLQLISENQHLSGRELLIQLTEEMRHPNPETVIAGGAQIFAELYERQILLGTY